MGKLLRELMANWYRPHWWYNSAFQHFRNQILSDLAYSYFRLTAPTGVDLMAEDWDNYYILDACRFDIFANLNPFEPDTGSRISKASSTPGFLEANFSDGTYYDTVYITANPMHAVKDWCSVDLNEVFHDVVDVWEKEWDENLGTVTPRRMSSAVREAAETYPHKRLLAHFNQPHHPFIGQFGASIEDTGMQGRDVAVGNIEKNSKRLEGKVWQRLERGEISKDRVWAAYKENLELTFPHIEDLIEDIPGRTVITSDHGNLIGEFLWPFPLREYGHPEGLFVRQLIKVPWLIIETGNRRKIQSNPPDESIDYESELLEERLSDLGYA